MKLWHCNNARSLRPLWALEEMGLEYELEVMPFPPRFLHKPYMEINPLGTIPYFIDGDTPLSYLLRHSAYASDSESLTSESARKNASRSRNCPARCVETLLTGMNIKYER